VNNRTPKATLTGCMYIEQAHTSFDVSEHKGRRRGGAAYVMITSWEHKELAPSISTMLHSKAICRLGLLVQAHKL